MEFDFVDEDGVLRVFTLPRGAKPKDDDFLVCGVCAEVSTLRGSLADYSTGIENGIAEVTAGSGDEWECGHCRAHHVHRDSPLLAECFTHAPPPSRSSQEVADGHTS